MARKLQKYTDFQPLTGTGRMVIMGSYPEAVWTEQCGKINELSLGFNDIEVDGYKVSGFFKMCSFEFVSTTCLTIGKKF